ncbi:MAG: hypothetical protein Q8K48_06595 [Candidatus Planktophila sp.]|nr:hypothetical protein [Candidatus Planktophila sp.]
MKKIGAVGLLLAFMFLALPSANAVITPIQPLLAKQCYPIITGDRFESYKAWVIRIDDKGYDHCNTYKKTRYESYRAYLLIVRGTQKAEVLNNFDKRVQACKVGETTFLLGDIKCLFRVSFFPTSEPIRQSWTNISKSFTNNQPMSYIPVAFKTINAARNNFGGKACTESGDNSLSYDIGLPKIPKKVTFAIACKPPVSLRVFRGMMVSILYLSLGLWLYAVAMKWWSLRESS